MRFLPSAMRGGISLAYLLARATDSVADSSTAPIETRLATLRAMGLAIAGECTHSQTLFDELAGNLAAAQEHDSEAELLRRFADCLQALSQYPHEGKKIIREVLATIIEGQIWDLTYFTPETPSVQTEDETRRYTYLVAGCVGEFWTKLGLYTQQENFCDPSKRADMEACGIRYGCGLQLVNILRDREEDAARGRSYLPPDSAPTLWLKRAERYLNDGLDYSRRLHGFRLRFCSMLPALIGLKTLQALAQNKKGGRVKIPRRAVYASMIKALFMSL